MPQADSQYCDIVVRISSRCKQICKRSVAKYKKKETIYQRKQKRYGLRV